MAEPTIFDETNVSGITIQTKRITGAYPGALEMILDTVSETRMHYDYIVLCCHECGVDGSAMSRGYALDPERLRIVVELPMRCLAQDHYIALYRIIAQ